MKMIDSCFKIKVLYDQTICQFLISFAESHLANSPVT